MPAVNMFWLLIYFIMALLGIALVRFAGPLAIGADYRIEEKYEDADSGKLNVAYRILAPAVCCEFLMFLLVVMCNAFSAPGPTACCLPVLFYWVILGSMKYAKGTLRGTCVPFLCEAALSIILSLGFDHFVIGGYLGGQGIGILDSSSIATQFEIALFGVATCWISSLFMRVQFNVQRSCPNQDIIQYDGYSLRIDTGEAKLFSYEREFGELLPSRFKSDILLRSVFFAIMAIEDGNRPAFFRAAERIAARLDLAKTTGIMQQSSDVPLSDTDSVKLAIPYVEKMWNHYLAEYARSAEGVGGEAFRIYSGYYTYDYCALAQSISSHFGPFYGDYCGTRLLAAGAVFADVLAFEERQRYGLLPKSVSVPGSICAEESGWLSGGYCFWTDHETVTSCLAERVEGNCALKSNVDVGRAGIAEMTAKLRDHGSTVLSVRYIEGAAAIILCRCDDATLTSFIDADVWAVLDV